MNWQRGMVVLGAVALGAGAWRAGGWQGLALVGSALVLWFLLYYTRLTTVMKRASERPIGHIGSAVMLNARLKPGLSLLHVLALTRSLGQRLSPEDGERELYRWTDAGHSHVTTEFLNGRLVRWQLERPPTDAEPAPEA